MMPPKNENDLGKELVFQKLGKSLVAGRDIEVGEVLTLDNLSGRIFNDQHIPVRESNLVLGKRLINPLKKGELLRRDNLE